VRGLLQHVAVGVHGLEQFLRHGVVVARGRPREQVVGQPERGEVLDDDTVVAVGQFARGHTLLLGLDEDGRAVLVGAADHEYVVAGHAHVPAEDVGRHPEPGNMTDVARPVGVRPGDRGENVTHGHRA
jgi:hypothetical protein